MRLVSAYYAIKELVETFRTNKPDYLLIEHCDAESRKEFTDNPPPAVRLFLRQK
jgi:hypothetical protein